MPMTHNPDLLDDREHEWSRLQASLHTRQAIRSLHTAAEAVEEAAAVHPHGDADLQFVLDRLRSAAMVLGRVDARVHAEPDLLPRGAPHTDV